MTDEDFVIKDGVLVKYSGGGGDVRIPSGIWAIGERAFYGCNESLDTVYIPDGVTEIGKRAFYYCFRLNEARIPGSVTVIGDEAFAVCDDLAEIIVPAGVKTGNDAFTPRTMVFFIKDGVLNGFGGNTEEVHIPDGVTKIGEAAFFECTFLDVVHIPISVTAIGRCAFYGCLWLNEAHIPNGVTSIGARAFFGCGHLNKIYIPDSVTEIGKEAFAGCSALTYISVLEGAKIGEDAFRDCPGYVLRGIPEKPVVKKEFLT